MSEHSINSTANTIQLEGRAVLLVDDHELLRMGFDMLLRSTFAHLKITTIHHAKSLAQGIALYEQHAINIGLVVLDLHLPDAHGLQSVQSFMQRCPQASVVVLSGDNVPGLETMVLRAGAIRFWPKAGDMNEICEQLQALLDHEVHAEPKKHNEGLRARQSAGKNVHGQVVELSVRQLQILHAVASGMTNREIAQSLYLSEGTVKNHVSTLFEIYGVDSRAHLLSLLR